jgi:RND superfamily putative drug exporter
MNRSKRSAARVVGAISGRWGKWVVLLLWLGILVVAAPLAGRLTGVQSNDSAAWLPAGAESTRILDVLPRFQPDDTVQAVVVYERASGLTPADRAAAAADAEALRRLPGVTGPVAGPEVADDGAALRTVVPIDSAGGGWDEITPTVDGVRAVVGDAPAGLAVHLTGPAGVVWDSAEVFAGVDGTLLYATLAVVVAILLLTYRSPLLWLLPVVVAAAALAGAQAVVYLLAEHAGLVVNAQSASILTVLVFGAGTDYALLLVARYREELRRHEDRHAAMAVALRRAGPAVVASAATVGIGLLCLSFAEMSSTSGMGPVAAAGVAIALPAMLTLLPALLLVFGRWLFWPVVPRFGSADTGVNGRWAAVGGRVARRPRAVWLATAGVLGVLALGLVDLKADGTTTAEAFTTRPDSVVGAEVLAAHFPAGDGDPVLVVGRSAAAGPMHDALRATPGVTGVTPPVVSGDRAFLQATLLDPPDGPAAQRTVARIRTALHGVDGADPLVGGSTATTLDTNDAARRDLALVIPLVLLVVLVVLGLLLRAVVGALVLMATVVLSFGAALGVSALVFDLVFGFDAGDASMPLFVFVFLVALGIDYNIFLMTRVREEVAAHGPRRAAVVGLAATGGVITSAGVVLAGTFATLTTLPSTFSVQIGFAVAFGVLLDTFVVRSILVTALNLDLGRWTWWPGRLWRTTDPVPADEAATAGATPGATPGATREPVR